MRASRRVLVATLLAVALHLVVIRAVDEGWLGRGPVRPARERVTISLVPPPPSPSSEARQEARPQAGSSSPVAGGPVARRSSDRPRAPADPPRSAPSSAPGAAAPSEPSVPSGPSGPSEPDGPSLRPEKPQSFLERVIAGTHGGPAPRLDDLDPSRNSAGPAETDGARAKRLVDGIARVDAPPRETGPAPLRLERTKDGGFLYTTGGFFAEIHKDGSVTFKNRDFQAETLTTVRFDPTAALIRAQGQDPYEHEKACFLDDTADLRADLREKHEQTRLAHLRRALERTWFDAPGPGVKRRAALFELWDECREEQVGLQAREMVVSFIRQHLPRGSAEAFTDGELAKLNSRRASAMEFRPYG